MRYLRSILCLHSPSRHETECSFLLQEQDFKMDVDSTANVLSTTKLEEGYSSPDDFWDWSDYMRSDDDGDLNESLDFWRPHNEEEESVDRKSTWSQGQCRTSIMSRPLTSTSRLPTDGQRSNPKPQNVLRVWHTCRNESYVSPCSIYIYILLTIAVER